LIILNSPNNPSGAIYPKEFLKKFAEVLKHYPHIAILSDEVYRTIRYDDSEYISISSFLPDQTFVAGGISKEVSGTGMRLGFVAGPPDLMKGVAKVQGTYSACANLPVQKGYAHFLKSDQDMHERKKNCCTVERKKRFITLELSDP